MAELPRHRLRHRGLQSAAAVPAVERPEAAEALRYIRDTMQQAGAFTAVSGRGLILVGLTALPASWLASRQAGAGFLAVWIGEALIAIAIAAFTIYRKAVATGTPLVSGPARKVAMGLLPAIAAGAVLTAVFYRAGKPELIVPTWLLLYGVGVVAGGAWSVAAVPIMGAAFMVLSLPAFIFPWPDVWMAVGFGLLHMVFGTVVTKRYGG
jgi:hypothetical protein